MASTSTVGKFTEVVASSAPEFLGQDEAAKVEIEKEAAAVEGLAKDLPVGGLMVACSR